MSLVPYSTQIGPYPDQTQSSQNPKIFLVYPDTINDPLNQTHTDLMKDAQYLLTELVPIGIISSAEIENLPKQTKYFVIPYADDKLVAIIRKHHLKPIIYTARCVVEARRYRNIQLPTRSLAISISMVGCRIFITKSCNNSEFQRRINEMCGTVLGDFNDPKLNVVVTNRADDKYCAKARMRNVPIVSRDWVDETYAMSRIEDSDRHNYDALSQLSSHQIRPFLGLTFRIALPQIAKDLKDLISDNGGKLAFGQYENVTHVVAARYRDEDSKDNQGPRVVDFEFLKACEREGYYMSKKEYRAFKRETLPAVTVKLERVSPTPSMQQNDTLISHDCFTPPQQNPRSTLSSIRSNGNDRMNDQSMPPPPPSMARQALQQGDNINAIIHKALISFENATQQTQLVSTQIRRLPETEIRFERTAESSQQLYWSDSVSRRH